jgi:hypothetical protein
MQVHIVHAPTAPFLHLFGGEGFSASAEAIDQSPIPDPQSQFPCLRRLEPARFKFLAEDGVIFASNRIAHRRDH